MTRPAAATRWFEVLDPGLLTTVQDSGRPGHAHLGVPPSGCLDQPSFSLANRLVGNPEGTAVLETTMRGPRLVLHGPSNSSATVAVTGAPAAVTVDGRPAALDAAIFLLPGQTLEVGPATSGLRSYIAVVGGIAVDPVLDSRSTDVLSGLGPPKLARGTRLPIGAPAGSVPIIDFAVPRGISPHPVVGILPGPRDDWFTPEAITALTSNQWLVSSASNRIGLRLEGPALGRRDNAELPPEGVVTGSIQIPRDGQPVIFLNDHPTTGGYPVIAVLTDDALARAAQAAPGTSLTFRWHAREADRWRQDVPAMQTRN